jgi:hypothetical protein
MQAASPVPEPHSRNSGAGLPRPARGSRAQRRSRKSPRRQRAKASARGRPRHLRNGCFRRKLPRTRTWFDRRFRSLTDAVEKGFSCGRTKFFSVAGACRARRCEEPRRIARRRPQSLVRLPRRLVKVAGGQTSSFARLQSCSILDFVSSIDPHRKSRVHRSDSRSRPCRRSSTRSPRRQVGAVVVRLEGRAPANCVIGNPERGQLRTSPRA